MAINENRCVMCEKTIPDGTMYCPVCEQTISDSILKYVFTIKLNTFLDVRNFVNIASKHNGDVVVKSGRWIIDGKSIMGLYSLDLSNKLEVEFYGNISKDIIKKIKKYITIDIQYI